MRNRWRKYVAITTISAALLTGCATNQSSGTTTSNTSTSSSSESATTTDTDGILATSAIAIDKEFTANDLEVGYEESTANQITLKGSSIEASSQDGVTIEGSTLTITKEGTYVISGTLSDGQIIVDADDSAKIQIVLNGVNITCSNNAPIYIKTADKVFITLEENTENTLTDGSEYVQADDTNVDGVIFSKADLTLNGTGILNITGNYKHGIASKDDLVITGGTYNITAVKDGLNGKDAVKIKDGTFNISVSEGNGIQSKNGDDTTKGYVYISGGEININQSQEGIEGTVILVEGGTVNIEAQDDGLNAASKSTQTDDSSTTSSLDNSTSNSTGDTAAATNSTVATATTTTQTTNAKATKTATTDTNATETANTTTNVTATKTSSTDASTSTNDSPDMNPPADDSAQFDRGNRDDFGNGGGGSMENDANAYISITGGTVNINAVGDGIDSNGSVYISGGTVYVSGPTESNNAGLDYNGTANITGGTVIVAGSTGMAQGFSDTSTQYSIIYNFSSVSEAGTEITLKDADGNVVVSYTPAKQYQSVVISSPDLKKDATYTLTSGSQTADVTLSTVVTSGGEQSMGNGARGGQGGFGMKGSNGDKPSQDSGNSTDSSDSSGSN